MCDVDVNQVSVNIIAVNGTPKVSISKVKSSILFESDRTF